jgi:hypothetical protein
LQCGIVLDYDESLNLATGTPRDVGHADFRAALAEVRPSLVRGAEVDLPKGQCPHRLTESAAVVSCSQLDKVVHEHDSPRQQRSWDVTGLFEDC